MADFLAPASIEEAQELLRQTRDKDQTILPCGRRTRMKRHGVLEQPNSFLSAKNLTQVLWFDAEDRTCEVQVGIDLISLQQTLHERRLEWGVCSPQDQSGTLGGLCLAPDHSFFTSSMGFPRDQILGGQWILADGTSIRTGARVVKSVAGYDLTRLLLGSQGQLAFCVSLVLKLRPQPPRVFWYQFPAEKAPSLPHFGIRHSEQQGNLFTCGSIERIPAFASQEISPECGERSLASLQEEFQKSTSRVHFPSPIPAELLETLQADALAVDIANHTVAFQQESMAMTYQGKWQSGLRIPSGKPFPWAGELAKSMTPTSNTFHLFSKRMP
jgi:hypothetical protein